VLCIFYLPCNSIRYNRELVFIINSYDKGIGVYNRESFRQSNPLFISRSLIQPRGSYIWINDSDVYLAPTSDK